MVARLPPSTVSPRKHQGPRLRKLLPTALAPLASCRLWKAVGFWGYVPIITTTIITIILITMKILGLLT